mgnify:FL=1|tara:strand:- start:1224 stop:1445 length:222 start_codon:yes stop_codon:yes gene_type:complete
MFETTNLNNDDLQKIKLNKSKERKETMREYHNKYYHNKTKNKIVYCRQCDKYLLRSSMKYHLEKSKLHKNNNI